MKSNQTLPLTAYLPKSMVEEIEQTEGEKKADKLMNYINKLKNNHLATHIDRDQKIAQHQNRINELENNLILETTALLKALTERDQHQKLMEKLDNLPDYDKLKELWHKGIMPFYKDFPKRSLMKKWLEWMEKIGVDGQDTYSLLEEDYKLNPHKYPTKNEEIQ